MRMRMKDEDEDEDEDGGEGEEGEEEEEEDVSARRPCRLLGTWTVFFFRLCLLAVLPLAGCPPTVTWTSPFKLPSLIFLALGLPSGKGASKAKRVCRVPPVERGWMTNPASFGPRAGGTLPSRSGEENIDEEEERKEEEEVTGEDTTGEEDANEEVEKVERKEEGKDEEENGLGGEEKNENNGEGEGDDEDEGERKEE